MKKRKPGIPLLLLILLLTACRDQPDTKGKATVKVQQAPIVQKDNSLLKEVLRAQLADGKEIGGDEYESHHYTQRDLAATAQIVQDLLTENGYRFPGQQEFEQKIKDVFGRELNPSSTGKYVFINFHEPCSKEQVYSRVPVIGSGVHIIKKSGFITSLYAIPELVDYQRKFPELKTAETAEIIRKEPDLGHEIIIPHWKDVENLEEQRQKNIQTAVARNMYLFNDNKTYLQWLCLHDEAFLNTLVLDFGYTGDLELLKWVVKNNPYEKDRPSAFSKLLWHKTCDGQLVFHQSVLDIIALDQERAKDFLSFLNDDYISYIENSKDAAIDLTDDQKEEIVTTIRNYKMTHRI